MERNLKQKAQRRKKMFKRQNGITLIALVITIIVMLILAGVSLSMTLGDNGILRNATEAKEKTEIANVKEQLQLGLYDIKIENGEITVSEIIEKLKEKGILNDDMTFKVNSNYKLLTNGAIIDAAGKNVENVMLPFDSTELEVKAGNNEIGTKIIKCADGTINFSNEETKTGFVINANPAPNGYKFAYWIDKFNNIISYKESIQPSCNVDNIYTACYVKQDIEIIPKICINSYMSTQTEGDKISCLIFSTIPENLNIKSYQVGVLITDDATIANENQLIRLSDYSDRISSAISSKRSLDKFTYTIRKTKVGTKTWYLRGFMIVTYQDETTETLYSNIVSAHK